jgi:hypothetical protein
MPIGETVVGIRFEWADERRIILNVFIEHPWTWQEYNDNTQKIFAEVRTTGRPASTVVDVTHMKAIPQGSALTHLRHMEESMPESVFVTVVVGAPHIAVILLDILMRIRPRFRRKTLFTSTMDEAHEQVYKIYDQLYTSSEPN